MYRQARPGEGRDLPSVTYGKSIAMSKSENPNLPACVLACPQFHHLARLFPHFTKSTPPKGLSGKFNVQRKSYRL